MSLLSGFINSDPRYHSWHVVLFSNNFTEEIAKFNYLPEGVELLVYQLQSNHVEGPYLAMYFSFIEAVTAAGPELRFGGVWTPATGSTKEDVAAVTPVHGRLLGPWQYGFPAADADSDLDTFSEDSDDGVELASSSDEDVELASSSEEEFTTQPFGSP